jgi:twinkle protein
MSDMIQGEVQEIPTRSLWADTCAHWGYQIGEFKGKPCHIANYRAVDGTLVAQKVRMANKDFTVTGDGKALTNMLYGQWLWRDGGKMLVITEGEIDALSVSQLQSNKWPVVSVPNGAQGAKKSCAAQLEWLEKFDKVILMFDMDEHGRKAAEEVAQLLSPGKAYVATLPLKDANEMLKANRGKEVIDAMWGAKQWRPDGVINLADLHARILEPVKMGTTYPWAGLTAMLNGIHDAQLVTITAGTGIGKSAFCAEIGYHIAITEGETIGYIALEEDAARTARRFVGIRLNKPIHLPGVVSPVEETEAAFQATLGTGRLFAYDHFGSLDPDILLGKIRYMVKSLGCRRVVLDHLSIVVSGLEIEDERKAIDVAMTKLRSLVQETGCTLFVVVHLRRMGNTSSGHENGAEVSLSHLRGSQSIAQLSDTVIALERDQQADDEEDRNSTRVRVLKDRLAGNTGIATTLKYDRATGRLLDEATAAFPDESL